MGDSPEPDALGPTQSTVDPKGVGENGNPVRSVDEATGPLTERYFTRRRYRRRRKELELDGWEVAEEASEPWFTGPFKPYGADLVLLPIALLYWLGKRFPFLQPRVFTVRYERQPE